jgi:hypothetical protein
LLNLFSQPLNLAAIMVAIWLAWRWGGSQTFINPYQSLLAILFGFYGFGCHLAVKGSSACVKEDVS